MSEATDLILGKVNNMEHGIKDFIDRHDRSRAETSARLLAIEQKLVAPGGTLPGPGGIFGEKSVGDRVVESEAFAVFQRGARSTGQIPIGTFFKAASNIISGPWTVGPEFLPRIAAPAMPTLPLRSLIGGFTTVSNLVEFARETSSTDSADYQSAESILKAQSDLQFTLVQMPVSTLAHWMAASRQVLDDSPALANYVNTRLMYQLERKTETEILFGDGTTGHLAGLCPQATPLAGAPASDLIAGVAAAASQLAGIGIVPSGVVCNPMDYWAARTIKASTSGVFLVGSPLETFSSLWNLPLSLAVTMPVGKFLVGDFQSQAALADRNVATLEISREHSDFFARNMVAILCEQRLALLTYRPEAFVVGTMVGYTGS